MFFPDLTAMVKFSGEQPQERGLKHLVHQPDLVHRVPKYNIYGQFLCCSPFETVRTRRERCWFIEGSTGS